MKNYLHLRSYYYLFFLLMFTISFHYPIGSAGDGQEEEQQIQEEQLHMKSKTPIIETVKKMFSFPTSFPQTSANYWSRFESLIKQGKAYFSPPTLE
uniref:Uncharacterized protein n=1 Tax=Solanum tuberosum TaxID=4113 RepID=M1CIJ5_SOLTU